MSDKIGIGYVTYKREKNWKKLNLSKDWASAFVVVNDGTPYPEGTYPDYFHVIQHEKNLSVGIAKNNAMRYLMEQGCDHIFLIEDDIIVKDPACFKAYIDLADKSGIQHLNYGYHGGANKKDGKPNPRSCIEYTDEIKMALNCHCVGAFSYYHRSVIEKVGYMDELYVNAREHCFVGSETFLTDNGVKTFRDCVDKEVRVLTNGGVWRSAFVNSFGQQEIYKLTVSKGGKRLKEIYTTKNHKWFAGTHQYTKTIKETCELEEGDVLAEMYANKRGLFGRKLNPSPFGIMRGIIVGDGHDRNNGLSQISLYGDKKELLRFFPSDTSRPAKYMNSIVVKGMPDYWKTEFPSLQEHSSILLGFLSGYFATDGSISKTGSCTISSVKKENIEYVRDICSILGIGYGNITNYTTKEGSSYKANVKSYKIQLCKEHLFENFFLLKKHKQRYLNNSISQHKNWKVVSVENTNKLEDVYCASVPETKSFVLDGNILTHNCDHTYRVIKAGLHPSFWLFADVMNSDRFFEEIGTVSNDSVIRKDKAFKDEIAEGRKYFNAKHGVDILAIPDANKSEVFKYLEQMEKK